LWVAQGEDLWETPQILGVLGDELCLVEIDVSNRDRLLADVVDNYEVRDRTLRSEVVLFGDAGGFFACSVEFLELWPKALSDLPSDVSIDSRYKAVFTRAGDQVVMSVRHARRFSGGAPTRLFRFDSRIFEKTLSDLATASRRLRDDLLAVAQQRAPQIVESLRETLRNWPA
jgi:hypothetical protein